MRSREAPVETEVLRPAAGTSVTGLGLRAAAIAFFFAAPTSSVTPVAGGEGADTVAVMVVAVSIRKSGVSSPRRWPQEREAFLARMQFAGSVEGLKYTAREALLQRCEQPACFRYLKHVLKALPPRVRPRVCVFLFPFGTTGYVSIRIGNGVLPRIP